MGHRDSLENTELYRRTDEVLHYVWDPIGISGDADARDEYYSYLPRVFSMLKDGCSKNTIFQYLREIEQNHMGLTSQGESEMLRTKAVNLLLDYRAQLVSNTAEQGAAANP